MLNRDEAVALCETVLAHARAAGAEDAVVSLASAVAAHARFADNRVTTSGRSEDLTITVAVWVGKRRGATIGNDASAAALRHLAGEAVQIARISPVHREYVPTLGPLEYPDSRGFVEATADVDVAARAIALQDVLRTCREASVTGAGVHTTNASATAVATANGNRRYVLASEAACSITARTEDGTGSGYYAGDHFDVRQLDAAHIARQSVEKAVRSRDPKPIEPGTYPVILEAQAVADLMSFLGWRAGCADRRRRAQCVLGQGRQDPAWRVAVRQAPEPAQRSDAP